MVQMTMQVSDKLAKRIQPIGSWLPTIIETMYRIKNIII